jgi:hypothetical protein
VNPASQPGMFIQVPSPHRNFVFVAEPHQLKEQIQKAEDLATAIFGALPAFVSTLAIENKFPVGDRLLDLRTALRDFLCCELEQRLADQEANPLPTAEQVQAEMDKARRSAFVKPPIEVLLQAQQKVSAIEDAIAKIEELEDGNPIKDYGEAILIPQYQMQLEQERIFLSQIQKAMEAPDEAAESPMSNGPKPGEGAVPDEAKEWELYT